MNDRDSVSGSGGLLSKVVKFVKSPTTHWSDLDRPSTESGDTESRLALKEMIERKRRNDFVRNREFDMLRKVRRRETLKDQEGLPDQPSFYPSSQPANTGERARTLEKIDEIEAQMSTAWFKRHGGQASQAAGATAPAGVDPAYDKTAPLPLPTRAPALEPVPVQSFAPTVTMSPAELLDPPPQAPVSAPVPVQAAAPASAPAIGVYGDVPSFNVEVVATAKLDPEIEEAAIRFANGDNAGAEVGLLDLLGPGASRQDDVDTWLTLFDFYRATGEQDKFDDAALEFAARFGRSAPQWALVTEQASAPAPIAQAVAAAPASGLFNWTCPSSMGTQSIAALNATLARNAPPWRIDWRHIKTIDPAALPALTEVLKRWGDTPAKLKFLGAERLLQVLTERSPTDDRDADPQWWDARLALLRVLGEMDEFELVALNYCVTYEVSPPAWEEPKNEFSPMAEDGQTIPPSQFEPDAPSVPPTDNAGDAAGAAQPVDGVVKAVLEGELLGSADEALKSLTTGGSEIEFNCRNLLRVDFGAAGDLLNWTMAEQAQGRQVSFKQVNRLVAAFFGVIGITESARVLLRVD